MALVAFAGVAPAAQATHFFSAPQFHATGVTPKSVATGDFDGDNDPDLVVANYSSDNVSILLGEAGGSFQAATNVPVGSNPVSVGVGDFNGDNDPDLVVAHGSAGPNNVSILLGSTGGTFGPVTKFTAGDYLTSVAVGEFNADNDPDLALTSSGGVSILLGDSGGSFGSATTYGAGGFPSSVAVGEFTGDNDPDLAVANESSDDVSILVGSADGSFTGPTSFGAGDEPSSVAVGDFNGDNDDDLAVTNLADGNVSILVGAAGATFTGPTNFPIGGSSSDFVAVGDFNGDNDPDLAVVRFSSNTVSILVGAAGATFTGPANIFSSGPNSVAIADFNDDNDTDLAVAGGGVQEGVFIFLGDPGGSFAGPTNISVGSAFTAPESVAAGDFDGDSDLDLAVANQDGTVSILVGSPDGSFSGPTNFSAGSVPVSVAVGDFNGDNDPDLAVANSSSDNVSILLGSSGAAFTGPVNFGVGNNPHTLAIGDFNGDNDPDLAVPNDLDDNVSILLGSTGGTFTGPTNFGAGDSPASVAVGNFNGDSDPDLAVANVGTSDNVSILLGSTGGSFTGPTNFPAGPRPFAVATGDFNGDNDADLVVTNINSDKVSILLGGAGASFGAPTGFATDKGPESVVVANFDEDSDPDLAIATAQHDDVSILRGGVNGTFGAPANFVAGDRPGSLAVGDFNGDNDPDLAVANLNSNDVSILYAAGPAEISIDDVAKQEGDGGTTTYSFTVTRRGELSGTTKVDYETGNGSATTADDDYEHAFGNDLFGGTVTFAPGQRARTIQVTVNGDAKFEPDEDFLVNLSNPRGANVADGQGKGTIENDDPQPTISIDDVSHSEGNSGTTAYSFTVSLSNPSYQTITVSRQTATGSATTGDSDFTGLPAAVLTFDPGDTSKQVTVNVNGDNKFEPTEDFFVNLSGASNATIADNQGEGTIQNDDAQPTISIDDVSHSEGDSGTTAYNFTVSLSNPSYQTITVLRHTANGSATSADSDYTPLQPPSPVIFTQNSTSRTVTVNVAGDTKFEPDEDFFVNLTSPSNATIADNQGKGTIQNDDSQPTISIDDVSHNEGNAGTTAYDFTVALSNPSSQTITVSRQSASGSATTADSDYSALAAAPITFSPGDTAKTVTVNVTGDTKFEPTEDFFVNLTSPSNATIADNQGKGTIQNDDSQPTISVNDVAKEEGNAGTTPFTFTVSLSNPSYQAITVSRQTASGSATTANSDYSALSAATITFNSGDTAKQVTVNVNGDTNIEPNEDFFVNLSSPSNATISDNQGLGTIQNDDLSSSAACTITGTSGNDTINGTLGNDVICALGGDDHVQGYGGRDVLIGGSGKDTLLGGADADLILGEGGVDDLRGQPGNDTIRGGEGGDALLHGGEGSDALFGENGIDTLNTLDSIGGNDRADGGSSSDRCSLDSGDFAVSCP